MWFVDWQEANLILWGARRMETITSLPVDGAVNLPLPRSPLAPAAEKNIREQIKMVLTSKQRNPHGIERRKEQRDAYPYPVYLTPVEKEGTILIDDTVVVLGKH